MIGRSRLALATAGLLFCAASAVLWHDPFGPASPRVPAGSRATGTADPLADLPGEERTELAVRLETFLSGREARDPRAPQALYRLGMAYRDLGLFEQAERRFRSAAELLEGSALGYLSRVRQAACLELLGRDGEAGLLYRANLDDERLDPESPAWRSSAVGWARQRVRYREPAAALEVLDRLIDRYGGPVEGSGLRVTEAEREAARSDACEAAALAARARFDLRDWTGAGRMWERLETLRERPLEREEAQLAAETGRRLPGE